MPGQLISPDQFRGSNEEYSKYLVGETLKGFFESGPICPLQDFDEPELFFYPSLRKLKNRTSAIDHYIGLGYPSQYEIYANPSEGMLIDSPWFMYLFISGEPPAQISPYESEPRMLAIARFRLAHCVLEDDVDGTVIDISNMQGGTLGKKSLELDYLTAIRWQHAMIHILLTAANYSTQYPGAEVLGITLDPTVPQGEKWTSKIPKIASEMGALYYPQLTVSNIASPRYLLLTNEFQGY